MYWVQRRLLSQNFLVNRQLVSELVRNSSISSHDLVLEVGPGKGIITRELLISARRVIAIEKDDNLTKQLRQQFGDNDKLSIIHGDFLQFPLPEKPYKVFSNLPFVITGEVIRKLFQSQTPPQESYLVMQSEAASKFIAHTNTNTMAAILYNPFWDIKVVYCFKRSDFSPQPMVDCVLLHAQQKDIPLIQLDYKSLYHDFVAYHFIHDRFAKYVPAPKWISLFKNFLHNQKQIHKVKGSFANLQRKQGSLEKIHRSRTNKNWRKFKRK